MFRTIRVLIQSTSLTCPACQHGRMFRSLSKMNVRCPKCGVIFERDSGEITGAMAINATVTMTLDFMGAGTIFFVDVPISMLLLSLTAFTVVFPIWFYRHSRGLWVGIIYLTGSMFED